MAFLAGKSHKAKKASADYLEKSTNNEKPWIKQLRFDPLPGLLTSNNKAIQFLAQRDLLGIIAEPASTLWNLPTALKLVKKQREGGFWVYPSKGTKRSQTNYNQLETYRNLGMLVEEYGFDKSHDAVHAAAGFLFSCQSEKGDFRGIYGKQYSPNYSAGIMELLIKAGYQDNPRIKKGFDWLMSIRQNDGGWAIPLRTRRANLDSILEAETLEPDRTKPFSHLVTGIVLRALAAHPEYRKSEAARRAGELLASMLFKADKYPDRRTAEFWEKFAFPFWFTDIVSSLDSISIVGGSPDQPEIRGALRWLTAQQWRDGAFGLKLPKGKDKDLNLWLCLAICRIFKRFYT